MKKVKIKIPAKLNLTLDIVGLNNGYHDLESLVCSINIYDKITVSKRKNYSTRLKSKGIDVGCEVFNNNAYKTAVEFCKKYNQMGVDILLEKQIPVGSGLGGSSADIAGVLLACKRLFKIDDDLNDLASKLGSDSCYMLKGGFAVLKGKGDVVEYHPIKRRLYFVILTSPQILLSKDCYQAFDKANQMYPKCTYSALKELKEGNINGMIQAMGNHLYPQAKNLVPNIENNIKYLDVFSKGFMTGGGTATFAVFDSKKKMNLAYKILKTRFGDSVLKAHSV